MLFFLTYIMINFNNTNNTKLDVHGTYKLTLQYIQSTSNYQIFLFYKKNYRRNNMYKYPKII